MDVLILISPIWPCHTYLHICYGHKTQSSLLSRDFLSKHLEAGLSPIELHFNGMVCLSMWDADLVWNLRLYWRLISSVGPMIECRWTARWTAKHWSDEPPLPSPHGDSLPLLRGLRVSLSKDWSWKDGQLKVPVLYRKCNYLCKGVWMKAPDSADLFLKLILDWQRFVVNTII